MSAPIDDNQVPKIPDLALAVSRAIGYDDRKTLTQGKCSINVSLLAKVQLS